MTTKLAHIYWLLWFFIGFGGLETYALASGHPEWTLSDFVWQEEGLNPSKPFLFQNPIHWNPVHWAFFVGLIWLFGHFIDHIWR